MKTFTNEEVVIVRKSLELLKDSIDDFRVPTLEQLSSGYLFRELQYANEVYYLASYGHPDVPRTHKAVERIKDSQKYSDACRGLVGRRYFFEDLSGMPFWMKEVIWEGKAIGAWQKNAKYENIHFVDRLEVFSAFEYIMYFPCGLVLESNKSPRIKLLKTETNMYLEENLKERNKTNEEIYNKWKAKGA